MNTMTKIRNIKNNKKGFTLVELIVVLVILAILLAILVPSLVGWISKARDKQVIVNARNGYLAMETIIQENDGILSAGGYNLKAGFNMTNGFEYTIPVRGSATPARLATQADMQAEIGNLANYDVAGNKIKLVRINATTGSVEEMTYYDVATGKYAVLAGGTWTVYQNAGEVPAEFKITT